MFGLLCFVMMWAYYDYAPRALRYNKGSIFWAFYFQGSLFLEWPERPMQVPGTKLPRLSTCQPDTTDTMDTTDAMDTMDTMDTTHTSVTTDTIDTIMIAIFRHIWPSSELLLGSMGVPWAPH